MRKTPSAPRRPIHSDFAPNDRLASAWLKPSGPVVRAPVRAAEQSTSFYVAAWLARAVAASRPARHVDISASPAFAAVASAFVPVDYYEFEPLRLNLGNLRTGILDFDPLPFRAASLPSLSTSGIIEHLTSDSAARTLTELARVIASDGSLLLCLPVGRPQQDARRVYTFGQVLDAFEGFELEEFSLVSDALPGCPIKNPDPAVADRQEHGTGCFWLRKRLQIAN